MPSYYYTCPPRLSHFPMALLSLWSPDPLCFLHFSFSFSQRSFEEFAICTYHARIVIDNSSVLHVCIRIFLFVISINAKMRKNFSVKKKASIIFSGKLLNSYAIFKKFWRVEYWAGLELARVPRVPGTLRNSEHHLWHPRILWSLILTGTRRAHSM